MAAKKRAKKTTGAKPKAAKKTPKRRGRPPRAGGAATSGIFIRLTDAECAIDRAREKWTLDMRHELLRLHAQIAKLEVAAIKRL